MNQAVMLVDDSKTILELLQAMLHANGFHDVNCCSNGFMATKRLVCNPNDFQAVFVDLQMPGMDGLEFLRLIGHHGYKGAVVIASKLDPKLVELVLTISREHNLHLLGSVPKPIDQNNLQKMLQRVAQFNRFSKLPSNALTQSELLQALDNNWVLPYFQPQICMDTNRIRGFECLCRLDIPGKGVVAPERFLSTAERCGLSDRLMLQLIDNAMPQFNRLRNAKIIDNSTVLAFNLSPMQLNDTRWPFWLMNKAQRHNLEPSQIMIEITESQALITMTQLETLSRLRVNGFQLALDDFGTGFTNLNQLRELPVTEIKIDRSFSHNISNDKVANLIVASVARIARELHIDVLAEGVENLPDLQTLSAIHINNFQGYIYSKPKAVEEIFRWVNVWKKTVRA